MLDVHHCDRISQVPADHWAALMPDRYPFLQYAYLRALEHSGAVSTATGWEPHHLVLSRSNQVMAIVPCYLKHHSRGEYVFDWSWAQAAESLALPYYPKLLAAIPFTPCPGPRWLAAESVKPEEIIAALDRETERLQLSSWHLLFSNADGLCLDPDGRALPLLAREDCQFHWHNRNFADFDAFLQQLRSDKRKNLRKERRRIEAQGVRISRIRGDNLCQADLDVFYRFYRQTYLCRGQTPYLNKSFFDDLAAHMADQLLMVCAYQDQRPCGAALFLFDDTTLYGRWWGGDPQINGLHFEVCYYQGIEFAIEQRLARFDPGTQGEHKLIRGFEPMITRSLHRVYDTRLAQPLQRWTAEERRHVAAYRDAAIAALPFAAQQKP
ncbi:GNAT family N-acetyltransferase [Motiliproteus sediminis]|uniref:GNAT family N-acetyltransferase n=1 Tax=Motiliproteus sediminis TaxID=1468178 RepID=UPI001AF00051|nr:GNAT family N-acetyltransferase [Motiliproteus sediminis]